MIKLVIFFAGISLATPGCSNRMSDGSLMPRWGQGINEEPSTPRASASMQLTNEGRRLLANGNIDDAISVLERSVGLDHANGQNYYYLSEAWLRKGSVTQAEEFNRLAELYLKDNPEWLSSIKEQRMRIDEYGGNPAALEEDPG